MNADRLVITERFRRIGPFRSIKGIRLMHVQGLGHVKELLPFQFFQLFQSPPVHLVIMEAPPGSAGISCFLQIFLGFVVRHAKLLCILPELIVVIAAGCALEVTVKAFCLQAAEQRRFITAFYVPVKQQLGAESRVESFRSGYGRRIVIVNTRISL